MEGLGTLFWDELSRSNELEQLLRCQRLLAQAETLSPAGTNEPARTKRIMFACLLLAAGMPDEAGRYLPTLDEARASSSPDALAYHALRIAALLRSGAKTVTREESWRVHQELLARWDVRGHRRRGALGRTLELVVQIPEENGRLWLRSVFADRPARRGVKWIQSRSEEIAQFLPIGWLAWINLVIGQGDNEILLDLALSQEDAKLRARVIDAWVERANERELAPRALASFAEKWLENADSALGSERALKDKVTKVQRAIDDHKKERSQNGYRLNLYWLKQQEDAIEELRGKIRDTRQEATDLIDADLSGPLHEWLDAGMQPRLRILKGQLQIMTGRFGDAAGTVEELARTAPKVAESLATRLFEAWAEEHEALDAPTPSAFQERYLHELGEITGRLKKAEGLHLKLEDVVNPFVAAHGKAEILRRREFEVVFGPPADIPEEVMIALAQVCHRRLTTSAVQPSVQRKEATSRSRGQMLANASDGFEEIDGMLLAWGKAHPSSRQVLLGNAGLVDAWADLTYDFANDLDAVAGGSHGELSLARSLGLRSRSLAMFNTAALLYATAIGQDRSKYDPSYLSAWVLAAAHNLTLTSPGSESQADEYSGFDLIRDAITALPADLREAHRTAIASFADRQIGPAGSVKPQRRYRFLKGVQRLVGDNPQFAPLKKKLMRYEELLREVQFHASLDGSPDVGEDRPFGVFLSFRHTPVVDREIGGFARFLRDDLTNAGGKTNDLSPEALDYQSDFVENYLKKAALRLSFVLVDWKFYDSRVGSRPMAGQPSLSETPVAYIVLKAKDQHVGQIPPIQFDLDFRDDGGRVILPAYSREVTINATAPSPMPRPVSTLKITQTLVDHDGRKTLELRVVAQGEGLVTSRLGELLDLRDLPATAIADATPKLGDIEPGQERPVSHCEWAVALDREKALSAGVFRFPSPAAGLPAGYTVAWQHFTAAGTTVLHVPWATVFPWITTWVILTWSILLAITVAVIGWLIRWRLLREKEKDADDRDLPNLNPFQVAALLRLRMNTDPTLSSPDRKEILVTANRVEEYHFRAHPPEGDRPNIRAIQERWLEPWKSSPTWPSSSNGNATALE
jgi:hypothetical protein